MSSSLRVLLLKELKELLRDPKILVGMVLMPIIILPIMGGAITLSQEAVKKELASTSIAVVDRDASTASSSLVGFLRYTNQTVLSIPLGDEKQVISRLLETNATILLEIPQSYGSNVSKGDIGILNIYAVVKSVGLAESTRGSLIEQVMSAYSYTLSIQKIEELLERSNLTRINPQNVYAPLSVNYHSVVKGKVAEAAPQAIVGLLMSQGIMLPITMIMMLTFSMQIAATSIAVEKEEKTLETLMTLPIGRLTIMIGKLAGSILVAVAGAFAYMVGFGYYMNSAMGFADRGSTSISLSSLGFSLDLGAYLLLGVTIFVTLVSGLALALSVAVFTDSVRSAQSIVGVIYVPVMVPMLILMFADLGMLPLPVQIALYALPYTHSLLASRAIFMGDYITALTSIGYITIFTVIVLYVAARIFTSERVITAKIGPPRLSLFRRYHPLS